MISSRLQRIEDEGRDGEWGYSSLCSAQRRPLSERGDVCSRPPLSCCNSSCAKNLRERCDAAASSESAHHIDASASHTPICLVNVAPPKARRRWLRSSRTSRWTRSSAMRCRRSSLASLSSSPVRLASSARCVRRGVLWQSARSSSAPSLSAPCRPLLLARSIRGAARACRAGAHSLLPPTLAAGHD